MILPNDASPKPDEIFGKDRSEWRDLNLRPPRSERGNFFSLLDLLSLAYKLHRRPQLAQQVGGVSPSRSRRNARYFSPFQILRNVSWVASPVASGHATLATKRRCRVR